jgi:hypothetical protein
MNTEYKIYTVKAGDTLEKISSKFYNSPNFVEKIKNYNNLNDSNLIFINQQLELPGIEQINEPAITVIFDTLNNILSHIKPDIKPMVEANNKPTIIKPPHGINEIINTFGDIRKYITRSGEISPSWHFNHLTTITLPFPIKLAWNLKTSVNSITCNKKLDIIFYNVFNEILKQGLQSEIKSFGGAFNFRMKRKSINYSTHAWGIAIDLNPLSNGMGTKGDMHPDIVEIFRNYGFKWGGDWIGKGRDPMHFQYCTGY